MTAKFKQREIKVATYERGQRVLDISVKALVLGDLGIHRGLNALSVPSPAAYYVVTHIPSGYKIAEAYKQRNCKALVERLHDLGLNWKFEADDMPDDIHQIAIPIIRAFNSNPNN